MHKLQSEKKRTAARSMQPAALVNTFPRIFRVCTQSLLLRRMVRNYRRSFWPCSLKQDPVVGGSNKEIAASTLLRVVQQFSRVVLTRCPLKAQPSVVFLLFHFTLYQIFSLACSLVDTGRRFGDVTASIIRLRYLKSY
jgi:hypothetical protein